MDGLTISDMHHDMLDHGIRRLHISTDELESANSEWQVLYDAHRDDGFRLWNKIANCFLASSFRTYPNMHGRQSNDTILETLHLELEACCTYPPSRASPTLYAVDGVLKPSAPTTWLQPSIGRLTAYETRLRARGSKTIDILRAMWELYLTRKHYALLQDMASEQAQLHIGVSLPDALEVASSRPLSHAASYYILERRCMPSGPDLAHTEAARCRKCSFYIWRATWLALCSEGKPGIATLPWAWRGSASLILWIGCHILMYPNSQ